MRTKLLFEDEHILVAHKPAGLATQSAGVGQPDVVSELKNHLAANKKEPYIAVVHRLDQPVEGILVFGKTKQAAAKMTAQLQNRIFNKEYLALVEGAPKKPCGRLEHYLVKQGPICQVASGKEAAAGAKKAALYYAVTEQFDGMTLVNVTLETGRFHQIRAQMAAAGMSLLGDLKYGSENAKSMARALGIRFVALCAYKLSFSHPVSGQELHFEIIPTFLNTIK